MNKISGRCIATHIMEMTRLLPAQSKLLLETYLDNIVLRRYQKDLIMKSNKTIKTWDEIYKSNYDDLKQNLLNDGHLKLLLDYKNKNIDLLHVKKVSGLIFSENDEKWLKNLFKKTNATAGFK